MHTEYNDETLYIIMPAYNEEENIADAIEEWYPIIDRCGMGIGSRLVIVNDDSNDKTGEIVRSIAETKERLILLNKEHSGHGPSIVAGYDYALKHGADYVFQTDSDRQTDPKEFEQFWRKRNEFEAILGKRGKRGDGIIRLFIEKVLCMLLWLVYDVDVPDANAPYRLFNRLFLEKYLYILPDKYFLPNVLLSVIAVLTKNVEFIEITFKNRCGKSSINLRRICKIGVKEAISFWVLRKRISDMVGSCKYLELKRIVAITSIILLAFLMAMQSSINIWHVGEPLTDSSVFRYIAREMQNGSIPYKDTFDHKGPLIYFINLAGMNFSYWTGVWIIEFMTIILTFFSVYRIGRLYCDRFYSVITVFCVGSCLFKYFEGGNLVEEYALPFITFSLYVFLDYFVNEKTNAFRVILCGFSFAAVCFLRINMASLWLVMCIGVIFNSFKSIKVINRYIFSFVTGCLILTIPIIIWLILNSAFDSFIDCYIKYNILYSTHFGGENRWQYSFIHFFNEAMVLLSSGIVIYLAVRRHLYFDILYMIYMFITFLSVSMSGNTYMHYGMIFIPMITYPIARFLGESKSIQVSESMNIRFGTLYLTCIVAAPVWLNGLNGILAQSSERDFSEDLLYISETVKANSSQEDRISVCGNWNAVYLLSDRLSSSYYSYQSACYIEQSMMEEYYRELEERPPKVIVGDNYERMPEQMKSYISQYGYIVVGTNENGIWNIYVQKDE